MRKPCWLSWKLHSEVSLQLRPEAQADLATAAAWYEEQAKGLGKLFLAEVRQCIHRIHANPEAYPVVQGQTRRALIRRFPYGIIFLIVPEHSVIVVLAVLHCGRDPRLWSRRAIP